MVIRGKARAIVGVAVIALALAAAESAVADTIEAALVQAYQNNPQLNAQRAAVRATDETVPQALSGYRPRASLTANVTENYQDSLTKSTPNAAKGDTTAVYSNAFGNNAVQQYGGTFSQTLLNGFGTASRTRQA